ncbi:MAG: toll/interleukin-1 receptor domain-containing protein [Candidatus Methanoperedens sp.]|nr:toll/interleukin-1 receptor domain-containing protein [Candidatus Methanoperedens sp.]
MPFKYACFISYPSVSGKLGKKIIKEFTDELKGHLELDITEEVYIDKERLQPGSLYNEDLAEAICQSACMIVVYVPIYEEHPYCNREFTAMERLVEKRMRLLGEGAKAKYGLIIPVIYHGMEKLSPRIKDNIHCCDFSKFLTATLTISQKKEYQDKIKEIVNVIVNFSKTFKQLNTDICNDCNSFKLPSLEECPPWREEPKKSAPLPFHQGEP